MPSVAVAPSFGWRVRHCPRSLSAAVVLTFVEAAGLFVSVLAVGPGPQLIAASTLLAVFFGTAMVVCGLKIWGRKLWAAATVAVFQLIRLAAVGVVIVVSAGGALAYCLLFLASAILVLLLVGLVGRYSREWFDDDSDQASQGSMWPAVGWYHDARDSAVPVVVPDFVAPATPRVAPPTRRPRPLLVGLVVGAVLVGGGLVVLRAPGGDVVPRKSPTLTKFASPLQARDRGGAVFHAVGTGSGLTASFELNGGTVGGSLGQEGEGLTFFLVGEGDQVGATPDGSCPADQTAVAWRPARSFPAGRYRLQVVTADSTYWTFDLREGTAPGPGQGQ